MIMYVSSCLFSQNVPTLGHICCGLWFIQHNQLNTACDTVGFCLRTFTSGIIMPNTLHLPVPVHFLQWLIPGPEPIVGPWMMGGLVHY